RLARRAGDADDLRLGQVPNGPPERSHGGEVVVRNERGGGPRGQSLAEVVDPAADRNEQVSGLDSPRVDLDTRDLVGSGLDAAQRPDLIDRQRDHAGALSRRRASRATSRSSNGSFRSPTS